MCQNQRKNLTLFLVYAKLTNFDFGCFKKKLFTLIPSKFEINIFKLDRSSKIWLNMLRMRNDVPRFGLVVFYDKKDACCIIARSCEFCLMYLVIMKFLSKGVVR